MRQNPLGKTGLTLSEIGLGTWEMSGDMWGEKDDEVSIRAILRSIENGVTFIDTAAEYGNGRVESLIGRVISAHPAVSGQVAISTKIYPECGVYSPPPERDISDFFSPDWIRSQCEASLRRLRRDWIDILFLHTWSRSWGHTLEWYDAMSDLKEHGKIRAIGISIPDEGIADANVHIEAGRVEAIQCVYNVLQQEPEYTLFPLAERHNVGIVARSPFNAGALTGTWRSGMHFPERDWRGIWPKLMKEGWFEELLLMAECASSVFEKYGVPIRDGALRFVLMNPHVTSAIPGTADPVHAVENLSVAESEPLPAECVRELKHLWCSRTIRGTYCGSQ